MFRALLCPSSGARQTAIAASGFRMNVEVEVFSAVVGLLVSLFERLKMHGTTNPKFLELMYLQLMYLQSHIYENIPVSFDFITTWNQGVFLCSPCISLISPMRAVAF